MNTAPSDSHLPPSLQTPSPLRRPQAPLHDLTDDQILEEAHRIARKESEVIAESIRVLTEIEQRKLYLKRGFDSLFRFLNEGLGYSKATAWRRTQAVRENKRLPEIAQKIADQTLSLEQVSQVARFTRIEEKDREQRLSKKESRQIYQEIETLSNEETEKMLLSAAQSPHYAPSSKETARRSRGGVVLKFEVKSEHENYFEMARALLAHSLPGASREEIYFRVLKEWVERHHPKFKAERAAKRSARQAARQNSNPEVKQKKSHGSRKLFPTRTIPTQVVHELWARHDQKGCVWKDPKTGRRCGSDWGLEKDHIVPFSQGGQHEVGNLQLLCSNHNQFKAQQTLSF